MATWSWQLYGHKNIKYNTPTCSDVFFFFSCPQGKPETLMKA